MGFALLAVATGAHAQPDAERPVPAPGGAESAATAAESSFQDVIWASISPVAGGQTSAQAADAAERNAPSVEQADAQIEVSRARSAQTTARFVPNLTVQGVYTRRSATEYNFGSGGFSVGALNEGGLRVGLCPDGVTMTCVVDSVGSPVAAVGVGAFEIPLNSYSLDLSLTVPFSDYLLALMPARRSSQATEASVQLMKTAEIETARVNGRIAYYDWVKARAQVAALTESVKSALLRVEDARIGLDAGIITSADALGLESLAATSQVNLAQAESFARLAEQNLRVLTGWTEPLAPGEDVAALDADVPALGALDELIAHGKQHRAEVRALAKSAAAADHGAEGYKAAIYPRLDGIASVTHANPNQAFFPPGPEWNTSWYVGLTASWRLDGYLNAQAQSKELASTARAQRAQQAALERGIELEVRAAWEEWQRAHAVERIAATELRAAEAMHEQRIALFRGGEATSTEVVEAELQRYSASLRSIGAAIDKRIAVAKMRRAAGLSPLGKSLGNP